MTNKLIWLLYLLCFPFMGMAQQHLDSIISASTPLLFDQPDKAIEIGEDLLKKAKTTETKVRVLSFIGNAYLSKRENSKSLALSLEALELLRETDNLKSRIEVLNSVGMQHQQLRMYDKARDYLDEALVLTNMLNQDEDPSYLLAYNYTIRGFIYREQMNCQVAQNYFDRAILHFKQSENSLASTSNMSTLYYNKGNCFLQTSQIDSAQSNFQKSILYAEKAHASSLLSFAKKGLSEVYTADGKYQLAVEQLQKADSIAANVGDMVLNRGIYQNLSNNFLALGDITNYEAYHLQYEKTQKDLLIRERELINHSLQNSLQAIKNRSEKEIKKRIFIFWVLLISGFLILISLIFMAFKSRKSFLETKSQLNKPS